MQQEKLVAPLNSERTFLRAMPDSSYLNAPLNLGGSTWRYVALDPAAAPQRTQLLCGAALRDTNCCWVV